MRTHSLGEGRRDDIDIHNGVSYFAIRNSVLFWLYILNPRVCCTLCFLSSSNQSAGDKLHYSSFFEFSQGLLSTPLLVLALFCYFQDLLVFPRWFFPWCQKMWMEHYNDAWVYLSIWYTVKFMFFSFNFNFNPCFSFSHPF